MAKVDGPDLHFLAQADADRTRPGLWPPLVDLPAHDAHYDPDRDAHGRATSQPPSPATSADAPTASALTPPHPCLASGCPLALGPLPRHRPPSYVPLFRPLEANPGMGLLPPRYQYAPSGNFFIFRSGENRKAPGEGTQPKNFHMKNSSGIYATRVAIAIRWQTLEGVIEGEMEAFINVGKALLTIRDRKLYREEFKTFNDYCKDKWGMGNDHANRLIRGSQVATNLIQADNPMPRGIQPSNEYQIRPLVQLDPVQQCEVWEEAVRSADGKVVTLWGRVWGWPYPSTP